MQKIILITGATDGIGFETAKQLVHLGHHVIAHGRSPEKVAATVAQLQGIAEGVKVESVVAELSDLKSVTRMVKALTEHAGNIDVLINNAGVYSAVNNTTKEGLDLRFVVNTIAPYHLTTALLSQLPQDGRVINLSSAAQAPVNVAAIEGGVAMGDGEAYAQSKLALTMWSRYLGLAHQNNGPMIVAVNPKSLLGSKMVRTAYGISGSDLTIGADILVRAALSDEFATAHGRYFDNDIERFAQPHIQALDEDKVRQVVRAIEKVIEQFA